MYKWRQSWNWGEKCVFFKVKIVNFGQWYAKTSAKRRFHHAKIVLYCDTRVEIEQKNVYFLNSKLLILDNGMQKLPQKAFPSCKNCFVLWTSVLSINCWQNKVYNRIVNKCSPLSFVAHCVWGIMQMWTRNIVKNLWLFWNFSGSIKLTFRLKIS